MLKLHPCTQISPVIYQSITALFPTQHYKNHITQQRHDWIFS